MKHFLVCLFLGAVTQSGYSQVVINLQLPPSGLSVKDQLWNLALVNSGNESLPVQLEMQLSDASNNQRILTAVTRQFVLPKGVKQIKASDIFPITYNVINPSYPIDASPNGLLPVGVFNICFSVYSGLSHNERISDECETIEVEPVSPPLLVLPSDQESLDVARPQFNWAPPAPVNLFSRLSYDLTVVEILPTQSPADAILQNIPVLFLPDIGFTSMQYPHTINELDTGRIYAWRIKARNNGMHIANSETWTFTISKDSRANDVVNKHFNYTKLSRNEDASFSQEKEAVHFEYINPFNTSNANIKIFDITGSKRITISLENENIVVKPGVNFETIDLKDNPSFINNHMYLLQLTNANQEKWYMKFQLINR